MQVFFISITKLIIPLEMIFISINIITVFQKKNTKFKFLLQSNLTMSNTIIQPSQHYLDLSVVHLPLRIIQSCKKWLLILKKDF